MKWLRLVLGGIVLVFIALGVTAFLLPAKTEQSRTVEMHQTPEAIFTVLTDVAKMPEWNRSVEKVEMLPPIDGKEAMRQTFKDGMTMTIVTSENMAPTHLVREMRDTSGPFAGSWTYDIAPTSDGSKVTLTEKSEINHPLRRLMVRIFGQSKYLDQHLTDLARHFGENAKVR